MVKFLKKCCWFLLLLVSLNVIYLMLLFWFSPGFKKVYDMITLKQQNYELLVLGNSMALDGIDTEYLTNNGISSYNLALGGDHVSTSLLILNEYLQHNSKPKVVVVGLSSAIGRGYLNKVPFKNPEVEFFYHPNLVSNIMNPPLLNFQWLAIDMMKIVISKDFRNAKTILGQWKTKKVIPDNTIYKKKASKELMYNNPFLLKIENECKKHGIKLIFVELPGANANRNSLPLEYTIQTGNNRKIIYNLNNYVVSSKIINPSTDWLAPDHLNENGAKKLTDFLYNYVIKKEMNLTPSTNINQ